MAIYHLRAKVHGRRHGVSIVAKAAYRAGERLQDERQGRAYDYRNKAVSHRELVLPENAPAWAAERRRLWNAVEAAETRKDAQLAREIELALPEELSPEQQLELVRAYARDQFAVHGMVVDLAIHHAGGANPHAHLLLTMRPLGQQGFFGPKAREWNGKQAILEWRAEWAHACNLALERAGVAARVDHRSFRSQGIGLEPSKHLGIPIAAALDPSHPRARADRRAAVADLAEDHRRRLARNTKRIIKNPELALHALATTRTTFTRSDLANHLARCVVPDRLGEAIDHCLAHRTVIALGADDHGREIFALEETLEREREMLRYGERLAHRSRHVVSAKYAARASLSRRFGLEQELAFRYLTQESADIAVVQGYAGAGKSYLLGAAREAWEAEGYRVLGAALAGRAADGLQKDSGIESRTLASRLLAWREGREELTSNDVLVIDEAGMLGTALLHSVLSYAEAAGAKVVLVGDTQQLQAIEAGSAMRAIAERVGQVTISEIRRQNEQWMRDASRAMGRGDTRAALSAYRDHDCLHAHQTQDDAITAVLDAWEARRTATPEAKQLLLAYRRVEVATLNAGARERLKARGELKDGVLLRTAQGEREFAPGDRLAFLKNDRLMGVKNGTVGTVVAIAGPALRIQLDDEQRIVELDTRLYREFDHGYASTLHRAQGATVDHVQVLASTLFDQHTTYVALSRHRESVHVHYDREAFSDPTNLLRCLSRVSRRVDVLDYAAAYDLDTDLDRSLKTGPAFERASVKQRIEVRDRAAREALQGLSAAELLERKKALEPIAKRSISPPSDLGVDYPALLALHAKVRAAHERFSAAAKVWDDFRQQHPAHETRAQRGRGPGAPAYKAFVAATKERELAVAELQGTRRDIQSHEITRARSAKENAETRRAQAEIRRIDAIVGERRTVAIQAELDVAEPKHHEAFEAWVKFKQEHPKDDVDDAYEGKGPGAQLLEAYRGLEKQAKELRFEFATLTHRRRELFPPHDPAAFPAGDDLRTELRRAQDAFGTAARDWAQFVHGQPQATSAARSDDGVGTELYVAYAHTDLYRRTLARRAALEIREARLAKLQPTLDAAERVQLEKHAACGARFAGDSDDPHWRAALVAERTLARLEVSFDRAAWRDPPTLDRRALTAAAGRPEFAPDLAVRYTEARRDWADFCATAEHHEVHAARRGEGPGAERYDAYRQAAAEQRFVIGLELAARREPLAAELSRAESREQRAAGALLRHAVLDAPAAAAGRRGEGELAGLWAEYRAAQRQRLEHERRLTPARSTEAVTREGQAVQDQGLEQVLTSAANRLTEAGGKWCQFRDSHASAVVTAARRGEGEGAQLLREYHRARTAAQGALHRFGEEHERQRGRRR